MAELSKAEREAVCRLVMGIRTSLEALHDTTTGVLQLLHAADEPEKEPAPRRLRFMGDDDEPKRPA